MAAQPAAANPISVTTAELSALAAGALLLVAAAAHLWVAPEHLAEWWDYGAFFLMVTAVSCVFGGRRRRGGDLRSGF